MNRTNNPHPFSRPENNLHFIKNNVFTHLTLKNTTLLRLKGININMCTLHRQSMVHCCFFQQTANHVLFLRRHGGCHVYSCYFLLLLDLTRLFIVSSVRFGFRLFIEGGFTLGSSFEFILGYFCFNEALYFSLKNLFPGKSFLILLLSKRINNVFDFSDDIEKTESIFPLTVLFHEYTVFSPYI